MRVIQYYEEIVMTLTVRLPDRMEQQLAQYCVKRRITRSEAVKQALESLFQGEGSKPGAYELGRDLFGPHTDVAAREDVALHSTALLREHFRAGKGGKPAKKRAR